MKAYFTNVCLGVFVKPQNAITYALKNTSELYLAIIFLISIWFNTYSVVFISSLNIGRYINDVVMNVIFFGLLFLLLYLFGKLFKSKATKKDIFFVVLLSDIVFLLLPLFGTGFVAIVSNVLDSEFSYLLFMAGISILSLYFFYIFVMILNQVQKISKFKSILVLVLTNITLVLIVGISNYFEEEQQNLGILINKMMINNTKNLSNKINYHMNITDILEDKELYEDAISHYFIAIKLEDDNSSISEHYYWISEDYKKLGRHKDALVYAKKSLALTPEDEDSLEQVRELQVQE